jgi:hypothetical protein
VRFDTYVKRASKVTTKCSIWLRNVVKITDPDKPFLFERAQRDFLSAQHPRARIDHPPSKMISSATSSAMRARGAHAGYGKRWFETLNAAVEVIPNPFAGSVSKEAISQRC